jgi:membrane-bound ClpP family serine protease
MGIIIVLGIVGLIIGLIISSATDTEGSIAVLVFFLGIIIGFAIAASNPIIVLNEDTPKKLVVVNGYYVDTKGNFVTIDNIRGNVNCIAIPESAVKIAPIAVIHHEIHKKTFWKLGGDSTSYSITFPR